MDDQRPDRPGGAAGCTDTGDFVLDQHWAAQRAEWDGAAWRPGERDVRVVISGGDELASLADDVNALSRALQDVDRQQSELAQSYRRFVPERVLSLLGKTSILEVDKQTFVSRHLAAMMLWFRFPDQVYEKSGRELFDNINEILERTASIVTQKGGAVFNFAYNGYDAVFEGGSAAAVSTAVAVQQEILDLNREREAAGRPPVVVHIALDEGNVMLGVVGDENQIEPPPSPPASRWSST